MKLGIRSRFSLGVRPQFLFGLFLKISSLLIIPLFLLYALRTDAIFYIIIYLQMLMIWAQAEIGLRQHNLSWAEFCPYFTVRLGKSEKGIALILRNVSNNPAYNLFFSDPRSSGNESITSFLSKEHLVPFLDRKAKVSILTIPDNQSLDEFYQKEARLNIGYEDRFGRLHDLTILFLGGNLLLRSQEVELPGFLLRTFREISFLFMYIRGRKYQKR